MSCLDPESSSGQARSGVQFLLDELFRGNDGLYVFYNHSNNGCSRLISLSYIGEKVLINIYHFFCYLIPRMAGCRIEGFLSHFYSNFFV